MEHVRNGDSTLPSVLRSVRSIIHRYKLTVAHASLTPPFKGTLVLAPSEVRYYKPRGVVQLANRVLAIDLDAPLAYFRALTAFSGVSAGFHPYLFAARCC